MITTHDVRRRLTAIGQAFALVLTDGVEHLASGISAREALLIDPLSVELMKLGVRAEDMAHVVQRAARLEAHGINDEEVTRIVWNHYRGAADEERQRHRWIAELRECELGTRYKCADCRATMFEPEEGR